MYKVMIFAQWFAMVEPGWLAGVVRCCVPFFGGGSARNQKDSPHCLASLVTSNTSWALGKERGGDEGRAATNRLPAQCHATVFVEPASKAFLRNSGEQKTPQQKQGEATEVFVKIN